MLLGSPDAFCWGVFQKIGQNGRPGGRESPGSISFDETSRMSSVYVVVSLLFCFCVFMWGVFQKIGQNGRPGRREPPRSISFDETSRIKSVWGRWIFGTFFFFAKLNQLGLVQIKYQHFANKCLFLVMFIIWSFREDLEEAEGQAPRSVRAHI